MEREVLNHKFFRKSGIVLYWNCMETVWEVYKSRRLEETETLAGFAYGKIQDSNLLAG